MDGCKGRYRRKDFFERDESFAEYIAVARDFKNKNQIERYRLTRGLTDLLGEFLCDGADYKNTMTVLTGPSRAGKSHFVLVLLSLLCFSNKKQAEPLVRRLQKENPTVGNKAAAFVLKGKPWYPIIIEESPDVAAAWERASALTAEAAEKYCGIYVVIDMADEKTEEMRRLHHFLEERAEHLKLPLSILVIGKRGGSLAGIFNNRALKQVCFALSFQDECELLGHFLKKKEGSRILLREEHFLNIAEKSYALSCFSSRMTKKEYKRCVVEGCFPFLPLTVFFLWSFGKRMGRSGVSIFLEAVGTERFRVAMDSSQTDVGGIFMAADMVYDWIMPFAEELTNEAYQILNSVQQGRYTSLPVSRQRIKKVEALFVVSAETGEGPFEVKNLALALGMTERELRRYVGTRKQ